MATLGGNSVHAATAVVTGGARAVLVARRGEDFPGAALTSLADAGVDLSFLVDIPGPTVRNWVIYEEDGSRRWLYRTPPERSAEVAPQPADLPEQALRLAAVVHVAAMPLSHAERIVAQVRRLAPQAVITLDTHETWEADVADRVFDLARAVGLFVPSLEELSQVVGAAAPADGLAVLARAGIGRVAVKAGSDGAYLLENGRITHIPALEVLAVDATGAGDAFCGGLAAGLARGMPTPAAVGLGCAVAATAITGSGSLRLLQPGIDRAALAAAGQRLAVAATEVSGTSMARTSATAVHAAERPAEQGQPRTEEAELRAEGAPPQADPRYDIEVMRREIQTIPDVIYDVLDDADGRIAALAKRLSERSIAHLWLTGCGDSAFAGIAAELAFQRHTAVTAHPVHALDLARYRIRGLPPASAVIATSYSGKVGRTIEAAVQARSAGHHVIALTNSADTDLARACDEVLAVQVPTLGFSPGTSTYVAMVCSLLRLAAELAQLGGTGGGLIDALGTLPGLVATTLRDAAGAAPDAAELLASAPWTAFLGAGPNEATARFGAAKLIEAAQHPGVATNLEEWAHEEYFVTAPGDPVVLINPSGAGHDRGLEILSELRFIGARPIVISDTPPRAGSSPPLLLPMAAGAAEELSPVTACLPLALVGFHLAAMGGKRSYNFPSAAAKTEHYETIHRVTVGDPA